jgi:hypothetical protein
MSQPLEVCPKQMVTYSSEPRLRLENLQDIYSITKSFQIRTVTNVSVLPFDVARQIFKKNLCQK